MITFETKSEILSEFTHDKDALVNLVNTLNIAGCTNYYQALINVDAILKNYTPSKNKNTIILFLTDGYPNEDVPNEESYFQYLKQEYPYIVVNGIQYEMGQDVLDPIKKVSDNQYIADMDTLNNVLFDASIVPILYEKFVLTDYIDTDNFIVESSNDIKVSQGTIDFNKEEQKITWTIDYLRTGSKLTMTIDALLKEEAKTKELVPTNKKETVISKIDKQEETIESDKTPILKDHYQVIYEGNTPSGCNVSNVPSTKSYKIFEPVEISDMIPSCEEYQFQEWQIVTPNTKRINSDYFEMPGEDVVIRAVWTNLSLAKSMNGEVYKYIPPVLRTVSSNDTKDIWQYKSSITKVVFQNEIKNIPEATKTFDLSEERNGGVMGYIVPNTDNTSTYTVYIQGDEGVIANQDSSHLFSGFSKLQSIDGLKYLDTSNVTNMYSMFESCRSLTTSINIYNPSVSSYIRMFNGAATTSDAQITVNYIESTSTLVDSMIGTKSSNSNVVKGVSVDHNITIAGNDDIVSNLNTAYQGQLITLSSVSGNYLVTSFKMNGTLVSGNQFTMPDIDVTITDIEVVEVTIIESEHNPYPNSLNNKVYGEKTFEGATSLTVTLDYQTENTKYDWIYLYDSSGTQYGKYGGTIRKIEEITIPGNYIKIVFRTNGSGNNYYGFKATVVPNYD